MHLRNPCKFLTRMLLAGLLPVLPIGHGEAAEPSPPTLHQQALPDDAVPLPEQPDIPGPVESGEIMEPDITILRKGEDIFEEYRINGKLYMVKITPKIGPPYYMKDTDGDGNLDVRSYEPVRSMDVPSWVLLRW